ncbi:MAG: hypothetical protein PVF80_05500, partial [Gammaproteobacteria bacterium]
MKRSDTGVPVLDTAGVPIEIAVRESASRERHALLVTFLRNWQGMFGLILVLAFFASAIFAPFFS